LAERFWTKVRVTDTCWLWTGNLNQAGYGRMNGVLGGPQVRTHRVSWELHFGPIPEGMHVCHTCDVRACVRPDHLFLGTNEENHLDKIAKGRQPQGNDHWSRSQPERVARGETKSKLTGAQVLAIRARYSAGGVTQSQLADEYGVTYSNIAYICRRETWRHI
jgi:hypothetical protein